MAILNIVIGVGGTGLEIVNGLLKIVHRYPLKENKFEWFVLDLASIKEEFRYVYEERETRFIKMDEFRDADAVVKRIKERFPDTNIEEVFPPDDYIRANHISNVEGGWKIRKVGYLSLIYHLIRSPNNILNKISKCIDMYQQHIFDGIRVSIVGSLAGGTGSGIFLPLSAFIRQLIEQRFGEREGFSIELYNYLAMPEFLAKGTRKPQDDFIRTQFNANAYQGLIELSKLLCRDHIPWRVFIDTDLHFEYNDGDQRFINNVFLFHDVNMSNSNLVEEKSNIKDTYLPYFQLTSWCLYFWLSVDRNTLQDIGNELNVENDRIFAGMGLYVMEYPLKSIVKHITSRFYSRIPHSYDSVRSINHNLVNDSVKSYSYATDEYERDCLLDKIKKPQRNEYQNNLSFYNKKDSIKDLKTTEPEIKILPTQPYYARYYEMMNEQIEGFLSGSSKLSISELIHYLRLIYEKYKNKGDIVSKKLKESEEELRNIKSIIDVSKKHTKVFKLKNEYFNSLYIVEHRKRLLDLYSQIRNDLILKMEYFESIQAILMNQSSFIELPIISDDYFEYPPPHYTYGNKSNLEELYESIYRDIIISCQDDGPPKNEETLTSEVIKYFWESFSRDILNNLLYNSYREFNKMPLERRSIVLQTEAIKSIFLEKIYIELENHIENNYKDKLQKYNDLINNYNRGKIEKQYLADPFIPVKVMMTKKVPTPLTVSSPDNINAMKESGGGNFKDSIKKPIIKTNNLIQYIKLIGQLSINDLDIDHLKTSYSKYLKTEEGWYEYTDPQFYKTSEISKR